MPDSHHSSIAEDAELAAGATGAVVAVDQIFKGIDSEDKTSHLLKAGVGAAVALGAWELIRRADEDKNDHSNPFHRYRQRSRSRSRSRSRRSSISTRSGSPRIKHHKAHLVEEIIGAYSVGKEMLGDRRHHVVHLVGEALGATGLIQELRAKDKADEERGRHHSRGGSVRSDS